MWLEDLDLVMAYQRGINKRTEDKRKSGPQQPGGFSASSVGLRDRYPEIFRKPDEVH